MASAIIAVKQGTVPGVITGRVADSICEGATDTLTGTPQGGTWASSNSAATVTPMATGAVISGIAAGADTILYVITGECGLAVVSYPITVLSLSDCDTKTSSISPEMKDVACFPNPAHNELTVSNAVGDVLYLYDMVGEEVKRLTCQKDKEVVDISSLASGVYVVQVADGVTGIKTTMKIVKE